MLGAKGKTETLLLSLVAKLPPSLLMRTARAQLLDSFYHSRKVKVRMSLKQNCALIKRDQGFKMYINVLIDLCI